MKPASIAVHLWRMEKNQRQQNNPQPTQTTPEQKLEALLAKCNEPLPQLSEEALRIFKKGDENKL